MYILNTMLAVYSWCSAGEVSIDLVDRARVLPTLVLVVVTCTLV